MSQTLQWVDINIKYIETYSNKHLLNSYRLYLSEKIDKEFEFDFDDRYIEWLCPFVSALKEELISRGLDY